MAMVTPRLINGILTMRSVFDDPETLKDARLEPRYFTRKRKLPFRTLLEFLVGSYKFSEQNSINNFTNMQRILFLLGSNGGEFLDGAFSGIITDPPDPASETYASELEDYYNTVLAQADNLDVDIKPASQQALSKQRSHMDDSPFKKAFYALRNNDYLDFCMDKKGGYIELAIDGTLTPLPNLPGPREKFGTIGRGSSSPTARASLCFDPNNHCIVEAELEPMSVDERTLARRHIEKLDDIMDLRDVMFIFDRGYPDQGLFRFIQKRKAKFLARVRSKYNCEIDDLPIDPELGIGDHVISIHSKDPEEEDLKIRVIKFELPSGETEMLVTNEFSIPAKDFMNLYHDRWPIEIENDILKNKLEMANFTGFSENIIYQDFWIAVLLSYVASILKKDCDSIIEAERIGSENEHEYQSNMSVIISSLKRYIPFLVFHTDEHITLYFMYMLMLECRRSTVCRPEDEHKPRNDARNSKFHFNRKRC